MKFDTIKISELVRAEYNPRKELKQGDAEYEQIKLSIQEFGYVDPIIINADYTIVGGHQRLTVLKDLGYDMVNVVIIDIPKDKERALNVALNKITGEWDEERLCAILDEISSDGLLEASGFCEKELSSLMDKFSELEDDKFDVDAALDEIEKPNTKRGDVWKLGRHRLMCGDACTDDIVSLVGDNIVDLYITDPPYNVEYVGKTKDKLTIKNDSMSNSDFRGFLANAFAKANSVMKPGAVFYIWHADSEGYNFRGACFDIGWTVRECLIWNKSCMVIGRQDYQWKHEPCLYGWKDGAAHLWASDRKQTTVIDIIKPNSNKVHPTMKPIELFDYLIKNNTKAGDIVLDTFGWSGTTIIACEKNGRIGYCMELDEKYCDVIITRWEELTGLKAELIE